MYGLGTPLHIRKLRRFLISKPDMLTVRPSTVQALESLLEEHGIDTSLYGKEGSKTVAQLFGELEAQECSLRLKGSSLIRVVHPLFIHIQDGDGRTLKEESQTYHATPTREEYTRKRGIVLAEKIFDGEDVTTAVHRALKEELGIDYEGTNFVTVPEVQRKSSPSYPQLNCVFKRENVYITLQELCVSIPDGYEHTEYFKDGSPRVTSVWKWVVDEPKEV